MRKPKPPQAPTGPPKPNPVPLTVYEEAILATIKILGHADPTPVAAAVGRNREYVRKTILRLRSFGLLPESAS